MFHAYEDAAEWCHGVCDVAACLFATIAEIGDDNQL